MLKDQYGAIWKNLHVDPKRDLQKVLHVYIQGILCHAVQ